MASRAQAHDAAAVAAKIPRGERPAGISGGPLVWRRQTNASRYTTAGRYTTVRRTSTLPRVALEYGHTWWALATRASAAALGTPGSETASATSRPKPPSERGPMPTVEVTVASAGTFGPPWEATNFIAPMKQAA